MKTRPNRLSLLAWLLAAIALSFPLQICWMLEQSIFELRLILIQLAPLNWAVLILSAYSAWLCLRGSPLLLILLPLLAITVVQNNWVVASYGINSSPLGAGMSVLAFLGILAFCVNREVIQVLTHPQMRWWLNAKRVPLSVAVHLDGMMAKTFDLSTTGAFVSISDPQQFRPGAHLSVSLRLEKNGAPLRLTGEVVRTVSAHGKYPAGVGIQFATIGIKERIALSSYLRNQATSTILQ